MLLPNLDSGFSLKTEYVKKLIILPSMITLSLRSNIFKFGGKFKTKQFIIT